MSIISLPDQLTNGTVADASQVMANLNVIVNDYNGNINNSNLSNTIAITDSKLNQITTAGKVSGTALTGLASIPSGAGVIPAVNLTYANVQYPYVKVSETVSSGTSPAVPTANSWTTMALNTLDIDTQSIASLNSNQVTLPAGTYLIRSYVNFFNINAGRARLYNITGSAVLIQGLNCYSNSTTAASLSVVDGQFTLSTSSAVALQYYVSFAGQIGVSVTSGDNEIYTIAEFTKVA